MPEGNNHHSNDQHGELTPWSSRTTVRQPAQPGKPLRTRMIGAGVLASTLLLAVVVWQAAPQGGTHGENEVDLHPSPSPTSADLPSPSTPEVAPPDAPSSSLPPSLAPTPAKATPLAGAQWFVDPKGRAVQQAEQWRSSRPGDAAMMDRIAQTAQADWFGNWDGPDIETVVRKRVTQIRQAGAMPVLVAYNIPHRDCGNYSAGGAATDGDYARWIRSFAAGIGQRPAVVVIEPDALAALSCLNASQQQRRYATLRDAVNVLSALPNALVYIDAGTVNWHKPQNLAQRLRQVGIEKTQGFALNVSNFRHTTDLQNYGDEVSPLVGDKHYIIDVSRNGLGPFGKQWCNPPGRGLGQRPTANTGRPRNDALLWIKHPGNSDGTCNGGPRAGLWWPDYALGLAKRAQLEGR